MFKDPPSIVDMLKTGIEKGKTTDRGLDFMEPAGSWTSTSSARPLRPHPRRHGGPGYKKAVASTRTPQ
jgi:hypothetical protein